jgi:hypothetical protein
VGAQGTAAGGSTNCAALQSIPEKQHADADAQLPTPPFKRAQAVAFARVLHRMLPCNDIEILQLPLFRQFFDSVLLRAKTFLSDTLKEFMRRKEVLMKLIDEEESKINWGEIYAVERQRIAKREEFDYSCLLQTVADCEERTRGQPKPEQSTPDLCMAYYHAMQVSDRFGMLLRGIQQKLPGTKVFVAPLKLPYRALEKMALEKSDKKWTASYVLDLQRGAIDCPNTGDMTKALLFLDACTSEVRNNERSNSYSGLILGLPEIQIVRVKNRFDSPAQGGWADVLINFRFAEDENRHIHELQIQHSQLVCVRKQWGEDARYANLRVLVEFLQATMSAEHSRHGTKRKSER